MTAKKTATATKASPAPTEELKKKTAVKAAAEAPAKTAKAAAKPAAKTAKAGDDDKPKRGRKPKAETESKKAGKKEVEEDVDLSDVDAELEGEEPEVEEVAAVEEETVKAKPLRMKVSRAKERALMREFGLEETALTEEEALKRRTELKTLIKMGKTRGFLTHQEINDHLPEKLVSEEILEAIISMLNDMG
jgi:RNA polymerase primary sigma factor